MFLSFSITLTVKAEESIFTEAKVGSKKFFYSSSRSSKAACMLWMGDAGSEENVAFLRATSLDVTSEWQSLSFCCFSPD